MTEIEIATFMRQVTPVGLSCLFVIWAMPRPLYETEVARLIGRERHTVANLMPNLELFGFVSSIGQKPRQRWTLTERARQLLIPAAAFSDSMVEKLPLAPSSSSDLIRSDQDQSDQIDPEEEESQRQKNYLCQQHNLTGGKMAEIIVDPWITPLRLVAWLYQVHQMKRNKFTFSKSPEAYAIACLLRHDEPSRDALHAAPGILDYDLRWMPRDDDDDESDNPDDPEDDNDD